MTTNVFRVLFVCGFIAMAGIGARNVNAAQKETSPQALVHGNAAFTDYFVLLLVDGEWKIANKVYYRYGSDGETR